MRLFRVSFTGESGFEINVPSGEAQRVWDTLRQREVTPYGTDAMHVLRAEKGLIIVGQETDGTVTPDDVGLGWTIGGGDFVGKRSLSLPDLKRPDRRQLVGLLPVDPAARLEEGAQLILPGPPASRSETSTGPTTSPPEHPPVQLDLKRNDVVPTGGAIGHITSFYRSASLGRGFALAMVAGGRARIDSELLMAMPGGGVRVTVTDPVFLDRQRTRLLARPVSRQSSEPLLAPTPRSALVARPSGSVQLAVLAATTRLSVRAGTAAATAMGLVLGVLLPTVPCRSIISRDRAALWLGPDEWLILAPETATDLVMQATRAAGDHPASIVDVSHRSQTLEITGARAALCLSAFCALDLDVRAFPVGMCTRTLLGRAEIVLWRIAVEVFHLDVARSFVPYVWGCLEEARLEFTDAEAARIG
jgi:sarcosine oxidase, subunit alpha